MMRSYKAISISFFVLALLVGCDDNTPSDSDIQALLSRQITPCPELAITDFQKVNGYPQTDGSYIEQVQYTITYTRSDAMLKVISDYDKAEQAVASGTYTGEGLSMSGTISTIAQDFSQDCPAGGQGVVPNSLIPDGDPDSYGKTRSMQVTNNLHLVKSDNGWVIQN